MTEKGKVWLAGAGPGDAGLLTVKTRQLLCEADVIVYDALVSPRCYKKAFSFEVALGMIVSGECGVFNPNILACFREIEGKLRTLYGSGPERLYE